MYINKIQNIHKQTKLRFVLKSHFSGNFVFGNAYKNCSRKNKLLILLKSFRIVQHLSYFDKFG